MCNAEIIDPIVYTLYMVYMVCNGTLLTTKSFSSLSLVDKNILINGEMHIQKHFV